MTLRTNFISEVLVVILVGMCFNGSSSYPASNTNPEPSPVQPVEIAPREVRDSFSPGKQVRPPFLSNDVKKSQVFKPRISKIRGDDMLFDAVPLKGKTIWKPKPKQVKGKPAHAFKPQKNVLRQNDEDDDDDDDGGEYGGVGDTSCKKGGDKKSMPMMIIRGFDVMAMDMPVATNGKKDCKKPAIPEAMEEVPDMSSGGDDNTEGEDDKIGENPPEEEEKPEEDTPCNVTPEETTIKDTCGLRDSMDPALYMANDNVSNDKTWGDWSSCSKSCGVGMQSRSRINPSGSPERDTQFKPCFLSSCPGDSGVYDAPPMMQPGYVDKD